MRDRCPIVSLGTAAQVRAGRLLNRVERTGLGVDEAGALLRIPDGRRAEGAAIPAPYAVVARDLRAHGGAVRALADGAVAAGQDRAMVAEARHLLVGQIADALCSVEARAHHGLRAGAAAAAAQDGVVADPHDVVVAREPQVAEV